VALTIRDESVNDVRVLALDGRLDNDTAADLELAIQDLVDAGATEFVLDLGDLSYISSAGLQVLLGMTRTLQGRGGLRLAALQAGVRRVFDAADATGLFAIFADRAAALGGRARKVAEDSIAAVVARLLDVPDPPPAGNADPELVARVAGLLGDEPKP
jgi:stage II sporulation protein AA (anti-sigma F factor antagonist)